MTFNAPLLHNLQQGGCFMIGVHPIYLGDDIIGEARIDRQGLYYLFSCRCDLTGEVMCRVVVQTDGGQVNLGIPVPDGWVFTLKTRVPVKHFEGVFKRIFIIPRHPRVKEVFIPLSPEEPFRYLQRLKHARLKVLEGKLGVLLPEE
jgi:hypothetical protein